MIDCQYKNRRKPTKSGERRVIKEELIFLFSLRSICVYRLRTCITKKTNEKHVLAL